MALVLADRVLETTTTAGSGTITLAGAEPGYQSFSAVGDGNQTYYTIANGAEWEVGIGTYTASGTTLSRDTVLSSSANGAKVTLSAGTKNVFVTYPSEKSVNRNVSGNISVSSAVITDVGYPNADSDAATKSYVDNMTTAALHVHEAVVLATPASSGRNDTYNNGTAGVSATLTATANGTLTIDSTVAQAAQRVLIKDCDDQAENGIYVVTTVGDGSTAYVMTRASDADTYGEQGAESLDEGSYFFVTGGTSLKGAAFVCNTPGTITFGTTPITFGEFSQAQVYSAGNGISLTATTISLASPVVVSNGGTGLTSTPTNGQLLIGNGTNYTLSTLTAGSGVSITNSAGSITLSATGLGGTVTAVTATGPLASSGGTTPDISIANTTGTGSVVLDQGATISSATITAALSASIATITGTSANITTVTGTTTTFSSGTISQLGATSATVTTLSGTNVTYSSGTVSQLAAASATIANISGTNVTYSNGSFTSATVTNVSGTNLSYASATITTGNLTFSSTAQRITGDMTNATIASRLLFQTSTANSTTEVGILPNGTGTASVLNIYPNSDPSNTGYMRLACLTTDVRFLAQITGTGTYLPMTFYTGGSERMRLDTSGNLGIGTSSPGGYKLNVSGAALVTSSIVTNSDFQVNPSGYNLYLRNIGGTNRIDSYNSPITATVPLQLNASQMTFQIADAEKMRIDSSGNVGIGTASPTNKLEVSGSLNQTGAYGTLGSYNSGGQNTPFGRSGPTFGTNITNGQAEIDIWNPFDPSVYTSTGILFSQALSATTRRDLMFLKHDGNVGIGTTSPGTKLTVSSATNAGISVTDGTVTTIMYNSTGGVGSIGTTSNHSVNLLTNNATRVTVTNGGHVSMTGRLGVNGASTDATFVLAVQAGRTSLAANSETYALGVRYASSTGIYYIGATNSATPDLVFSQVGGSERARLTNAGGFSVGTTADPGAGAIYATGNITAYYSDARLKDFKGKIGGALDKVSQLNGYYYTENAKAEEFGYNNKAMQVGVSAQEVKAVLPEVVSAAPFDLDEKGESKSGENYMTVNYEKLVPLLIEAIKELKAEVDALKRK